MRNKKFLSVLLCGTMAATMLAGCQKQAGSDSTSQQDSSSQESSVQESSSQQTVKAGEIPQDYKYYYSFDAADNKTDIQPTAQTIGGDPILSAADKDVVYIPGVKGDAVYTDGITGYKLTDVNGVGDNYTISFWIYATRLSNYMPTVQFGPDVHGDATGGQHYTNITRAEWSGEGTFPCIWSYDQLDNALWPAWSDAATGEPMKQWVQIALVVDSNNLSADGTLIASKLYINGQEWITKDSDGNVVYGSVTSEAKDALAYIRQLYSDGIIDNDFLLRTTTNICELIEDGRCGSFFGPWWAPNNPLANAVNTNPDADWQPYLIQTSDDGSTSYHSQNPCYKYVVVRKGFEHPEIAAKIISVMFDSARYDSNALQEFIYYYQQNVEPTARPISINVDYNNALSICYDKIDKALKGESDPDKLELLEKSYYDACSSYISNTGKNYIESSAQGSDNTLERRNATSTQWAAYVKYTL